MKINIELDSTLKEIELVIKTPDLMIWPQKVRLRIA